MYTMIKSSPCDAFLVATSYSSAGVPFLASGSEDFSPLLVYCAGYLGGRWCHLFEERS